MGRREKLDSVQRAVEKALSQNREIDWDRFSYLISEEYECSVRTAKEYIEVVKIKLKI